MTAKDSLYAAMARLGDLGWNVTVITRDNKFRVHVVRALGTEGTIALHSNSRSSLEDALNDLVSKLYWTNDIIKDGILTLRGEL